ncbi:MAG: hypothetical protein K8R53_06220, partial [Bacteroidales bacterium]|nr:hypothetical protein [Bacteroidales bacterium]
RYINSYPFLVTAHYYLGDYDASRAFLGAGVGAYRIIQRTNVGIYGIEDKNWHFGISPEAGIILPVSFETSLFVSLKYNHAFKAKDTIDFSYFSLHVGFAWGSY